MTNPGVLKKLLQKSRAGKQGCVMPSWKVHQNELFEDLDVQQTLDGRTIIQHREYITDITTGASGAFNIATYPIQPGNASTFPWLALLAQYYEQYRIIGMTFEFKSTSGDGMSSTNTALGTVIMSAQYDATKPAPVNKLQMENHQYAMSAKQSCSMMFPVECGRGQDSLEDLYIRVNNWQPTSFDTKMYDFGNFYIATFGQQGSNINIGELHCNYVVELLKPSVTNLDPLQIQTDHMTATSGISTSNYFGTSPTHVSNSSILVQSLSSTQITVSSTVPVGTVLLFIYAVNGTAMFTSSPPNIAITSGGSFVHIWDGGNEGGVAGVTPTNFITLFHMLVTGTSPVITFSVGTMPMGTLFMDLYVTVTSPQVVTLPVEVAVTKRTIADIIKDMKKLEEELKEYLK